jgi:site-specific recombinase XerD
MNDRSNAEWVSRFEAYLNRRFHDRSTPIHYVSDLRLFVQFHSSPLSEVTIYDIDAFVDQQHILDRAAATVKRRVAALKTFFDFLADELGEPNRPNPVSVRRHAGPQPKHLPRDLSDAEIERLLSCIQEPRDLAIVAQMLYAGLRVGEVATLSPADISVPQDHTAPVHLRVLGKGRKERTAYLCRRGYEYLQRYLLIIPIEPHQSGTTTSTTSSSSSISSSPSAAATAAPDDEDPRNKPIFRNCRSKPISIGGIEQRLSEHGRRIGIKLTPHRLRHTYGRWMAESRLPVLSLAKLMGHTSIQTTQRYVDGADPDLRQGYEEAMQKHLMAAEATPTPQRTPDADGVAPSIQPAVVGPTTVTRDNPGSCPTQQQEWLAWAPEWLKGGCLAWLSHQWPLWKPSQRKHHAQIRLSDLRAFWQWQLARHPRLASFGDLTSDDVNAFADAQLARGLAIKTVKTSLDRVFELLRFLKDRDLLEQMPRRPALKLPDPLPRHLQPGEVLALEKWVDQRRQQQQQEQTGPANKSGSESASEWRLQMALYYLLGHAGLRISEALDLEVKDLDLGGRRVRVREGKGGRDRVVYLSVKASEVLGEYLQTVPHASGDLVLSWRGRAMGPGQARRHLRRLGEEAGVEVLSPHRLRHTYATVLLNNGLGIEELRRLMGHESLSTTLIYARLSDTTLERHYRAAMEGPTVPAQTTVVEFQGQPRVTIDNSM